MENTHRQSGLDGLRGLAALLVFGVHVWIYQLPNTVELQRDSFGELLLFEARVSFVMFFVLSGYLLYRPFARAALGESEPVSVRSYLIRRAARIMPAYYLAMAATLVLIGTAGDVPGTADRRDGRAAVVRRLRPELLASHAAEAERRHVDARGRGGLLPAASVDRPGRAAFLLARPDAGVAAPVTGGSGSCLERHRLLRRLGTGRESLGAFVPALLRLRDAGRADRRATPRNRNGADRPPRDNRCSPGRRSPCCLRTATGTRPTGLPTSS